MAQNETYTPRAERRHSVNALTPRFLNPMAESTCINSTPIAIRKPLHMALSPTHRSSSTTCLSSTNDPPRNRSSPDNTLSRHQLNRSLSSTNAYSMSRERLNLSTLDPKIFADVHSSGLASRVVKYHDNAVRKSRNIHRSISMNNLPHTPMHRISRTQLPRLPSRNAIPKVTMTRITTPERSFYSGNSVGSLLSSNSVLGVQKPHEQLSRENRPIMHPSPHETEPTRSVLEALKEISRKRINTPDVQQAEFNKKSCNRLGDFADGWERPMPVQQPTFQTAMMHMHHYQQLPQPGNFKRQRELSVAVPLHYQHHHHQQQQPHHNFHPRPHHHQMAQQLPHQGHHHITAQPTPIPLQLMPAYGPPTVSPSKSPEQPSKRRNCNYSNDILSSLSSSRKQNQKRKLYDMRTKQRVNRPDLQFSGNDTTASATASGSSPESSPSQHVAKIQRKQQTADFGIDILTKSQSCYVPITPLPDTPSTQDIPGSAAGVPTQRTVSAPVIGANRPEQHQQKPKLTLFNTQQQNKSRQDDLPYDLDSPDIESGEYAGIQFVKPKQQPQNSVATKNCHIERTQNCKLALMLSSLRGELYEEGESTIDATDKTSVSMLPETLPSPIKPLKMVSSNPGTSPATPTTTKTTTPKSIAAIVSTTNTEVAAISSAAVSPIPPVVTALPEKPIIQTVITITPNASTTAKTTAVAVQPTFTFGLTVNTVKSTAAATTDDNKPASIPKLNFNGPAAGVNFNFGTSTTSTASTAVTTVAPVSNAFNFGQPTATATTASSSKPMFGFEQPKPTAMGSPTNAAATFTTPATVTPIFSFGSSVGTVPAPPITAAAPAATLTAPKAIFSLGNIPSAKTVATTLSSMAPPTFGSANAGFTFAQSAGAASNSKAAPAAAATTTATTTTKAFSFGASTTTAAAPAATTAPPPMFGNNSTTPAQQTNIAFGSTATPAANNIFGSVFKTPATTTAGAVISATTTTESAKPFVFGGAPSFGSPAPAVSVPATTASNTPFAFGSGRQTTTAAPAATSNNLFTPKTIATASPFSVRNPTTANLFAMNSSTATTASTTTPSNSETPKQAALFNFGASSDAAAEDKNKSSGNIFAFGDRPAASNGNNAVSTFAAAPTATASLFNAPAAAATASTNIFANASNSFSNSANLNNSFSTTANAGNSFNNTANGNNKPFVFGGFGSSATPVNSATTPSKAFGFGSGTTNSPNNSRPGTPINNGGNLFANAVAAAQKQAPPSRTGGFSFGNPATGATAAAAPFTFGSNNNAAAPVQQQSNGSVGINKPFTFGAAAVPPMSNGNVTNMFGGATGVAPSPASNAPFTFGAVAANTAAPGGATQPQMNASGGVSLAPVENRPIRRATRRLQNKN